MTKYIALLFLTLFIHACNTPQEDKANQKLSNQDSLVSLQEIRIASLPDSLQPKTVYLDQMPAAEVTKAGMGEVKMPFIMENGGKSNFTNFTTDNGLALDAIECSFMDKSGNIWFGTADGVSRFDGKQFLSIPFTNTKIKNSLSGNSVNNNLSATNDVLCIMQSKTGKLWFGTSDEVYCYDGKSFSLFLDNDSIINKENLLLKKVESIIEDKNGNIWFGSFVNEGVCLYDGKSLTRPFSSILLNKFSNKRIMCIKEDKNGIIWFGAGAGTFYYDGKNLTNITEKAAIYWTNSIFEDSNGNLWFATEDGSGQLDESGGVWRFDGKSFTKFTTKEGLIHNGVFCSVEDKSGNLWFGTRNMGLCRYDGKTFTKFSE